MRSWRWIVQECWPARAICTTSGLETALDIGPFQAGTHLLPHWVPNVGVRLAAGGDVLAYTGDSGPAPEVVELATGADLLLAEATYVNEVASDARAYLSSARDAGRRAAAAGAGRLMLTHLWPGTAASSALHAASQDYSGPIDVATADLTVGLR